MRLHTGSNGWYFKILRIFKNAFQCQVPSSSNVWALDQRIVQWCSIHNQLPAILLSTSWMASLSNSVRTVAEEEVWVCVREGCVCVCVSQCCLCCLRMQDGKNSACKPFANLRLCFHCDMMRYVCRKKRKKVRTNIDFLLPWFPWH